MAVSSSVKSGISQEIQKKYLPYVDDMDDLMYSNPNYKFYVGFDNQQMMFRLTARNAIHLDKIVRHFREIDQSSFFTGRREPVYQYAVSPFGYFPTGLLFEVLNFVVNDFELNPTGLSSAKLVLIGNRAKSYVYEYLVPLAKKASELKIDRNSFEVDNISMDRAEDPSDSNVRILRPYQEEAIRAILFKGNGRCLIQAATGCHSKGTHILLMDGSVKKVEDIAVGDKLVGDDGTPRTVLQLCRGRGKMYKIVPTKGIPFIVNDEHILSLVKTNYDEPHTLVYECNGKQYSYEKTSSGYVVDISVKDYLNTSKNFKHLHKLYRTNSMVEFTKGTNQDDFIIDPYMMGLLLGDGCFAVGCSITTIDKEIEDIIYKEAEKFGIEVRVSTKETTLAKDYHFVSKEKTKGKNPLLNEIKRLGLFRHLSGDKFIPDCYKYGSVDTRLKLLAGLIDTDGGGGGQSFGITLKSKQMIDDIAFIALSLGITTSIRKKIKKCTNTGYVGEYWSCTLKGKNTKLIPIRIPRKMLSEEPAKLNYQRTGFTIEELDDDNYYGFVLDGNHRYVMADDGFITHNSGKSFIIANLIYTLQRQFFAGETFRTLIYVPNIQLVEQFYSDLLEYGFRPDEVCRFSGSTKAKDRKHILTAPIVIANSTYCLQHISEIGKIDMVIGDEAHKTFNYGTAGFSVLENFLMETKLRVGLSGTLPKGFKFHQMVGLTGPKVFDASVTELQEQGFLSNCSITRLNIEVKEIITNRELLFHPNSIYKVNSVDETGMSLVGSGDPFRAEQKYMVDKCEKMFSPILDYLLTETTAEDNAIILFDRTEMGERIFNYLDLMKERGEIDRTPLFIDGSIPVAERERVRKYVEENTGCLLVGQSAILSTGINIKSLSKLVLFVGGKAMARTIQSIGRILRIKQGKQAEVIDVCYSTKYSKRHAAERKRLYKEFYDKDRFDKVVELSI